MPRKLESRPRRPSSRPSLADDALRPQSVVFTLFAEHLLGRKRRAALGCGSIIEVLGRLGIGEHATRSTLTRMARRDLLERHKRGREIYFRMTPRCVTVLEDGRERIWRIGAVNDSRSEEFTLLTFSMPETFRRKRYDLRARLGWAGFGLLRNGAWLAPRPVDVSKIVRGLGLSSHVQVFRIRAVAPTDPAAVIREAFDLDAIAERYRAFIRTWRKPSAHVAPDPLSLTLRLSTDWLRTIRDDPRVPVRLLPERWPAIEAQALFRSLHAASYPAARALVASSIEIIEI